MKKILKLNFCFIIISMIAIISIILILFSCFTSRLPEAIHVTPHEARSHDIQFEYLWYILNYINKMHGYHSYCYNLYLIISLQFKHSYL